MAVKRNEQKEEEAVARPRKREIVGKLATYFTQSLTTGLTTAATKTLTAVSRPDREEETRLRQERAKKRQEKKAAKEQAREQRRQARGKEYYKQVQARKFFPITVQDSTKSSETSEKRRQSRGAGQ